MIEISNVDLLSLEGCVGCAEKFHAIYDGSVPFDRQAFLNYWKWQLSGNSGVFIAAKSDGKVIGGIGGVVTTFQTSSVPSLVEMFWWVEEEFRGALSLRLIRRFEKEGEKLGAKRVLMACMESSEPDKVERIYLARGYKPFERHYIKSLGGL